MQLLLGSDKQATTKGVECLRALHTSFLSDYFWAVLTYGCMYAHPHMWSYMLGGICSSIPTQWRRYRILSNLLKKNPDDIHLLIRRDYSKYNCLTSCCCSPCCVHNLTSMLERNSNILLSKSTILTYSMEQSPS
jgi:hypothetical protein